LNRMAREMRMIKQRNRDHSEKVKFKNKQELRQFKLAHKELLKQIACPERKKKTTFKVRINYGNVIVFKH